MKKLSFIFPIFLLLFASCQKEEITIEPYSLIGSYIGAYDSNLNLEITDKKIVFQFSDGTQKNTFWVVSDKAKYYINNVLYFEVTFCNSKHEKYNLILHDVLHNKSTTWTKIN